MNVVQHLEFIRIAPYWVNYTPSISFVLLQFEITFKRWYHLHLIHLKSVLDDRKLKGNELRSHF